MTRRPDLAPRDRCLLCRSRRVIGGAIWHPRVLAGQAAVVRELRRLGKPGRKARKAARKATGARAG